MLRPAQRLLDRVKTKEEVNIQTNKHFKDFRVELGGNGHVYISESSKKN